MDIALIRDLIANVETLEAETAGLEELHGRVTSGPVSAPEPVPGFARALMDGYAVRARDLFGASETLPALLRVAGEVRMGEIPAVSVGAGEAVAVPTGAMLPAGADAVVMVEYTSPLDEQTIEVIRPVAPGGHVLAVGEDVSEGEQVFPAGYRLRPQDVALLAALGITRVRIRRLPRVALAVVGGQSSPEGGRLSTDLSHAAALAIAGLVRERGARVAAMAALNGDFDHDSYVLANLAKSCDMVCVIGLDPDSPAESLTPMMDRIPRPDWIAEETDVRAGATLVLARAGRCFLAGLPGAPRKAMALFQECAMFLLNRLEGDESREKVPGGRPVGAGPGGWT